MSRRGGSNADSVMPGRQEALAALLRTPDGLSAGDRHKVTNWAQALRRCDGKPA